MKARWQLRCTQFWVRPSYLLQKKKKFNFIRNFYKCLGALYPLHHTSLMVNYFYDESKFLVVSYLMQLSYFYFLYSQLLIWSLIWQKWIVTGFGSIILMQIEFILHCWSKWDTIYCTPNYLIFDTFSPQLKNTKVSNFRYGIKIYIYIT